MIYCIDVEAFVNGNEVTRATHGLTCPSVVSPSSDQSACFDNATES